MGRHRVREDWAVPDEVRAAVIERDASCCRICGRFVETPALHHIVFRSHGGSNDESNLVTLGWLPGHDCHLQYAHGPQARQMAALLTQVVETPGVNALQLLRWYRSRLSSQKEGGEFF